MTEIVVIGGGALGLATAAELAARGRAVTVVDASGPSASAGAAGMLAPAFETVLDPLSAGHGALLRRARDLWPDFAKQSGIKLYREGAEWRGPDAEGVLERLLAAGFAVERTEAGLFTPEDWRLEPKAALKALRKTRGVALVEDHAVRIEGDRISLASGGAMTAEAVVLAGGWLSAPEGAGPLPPIRPIKGQAVRIKGSSPKRVLRGAGVYVAPTRKGAVVGATMQEGAGDLEVDPDVTATLMARALAIWPELASAREAEAYAGVRGASPDGLPYAGRLRDGLFCALAPRRNGWLLAPMVARIVADALEGRGPDPISAAMDPGRAALNPPG